ncbi:hypothetical protein ABIB40_002192 [Pedobacter sp. UYP30]|uniref:basic secretory protein-like protein n=1 Tax=Pedobacter sp. UYP30 TaxID=1756400 RepID=UPI0033993CBB
MKRFSVYTILFLFSCLIINSSQAQEKIKKKGYTLLFESNDATFSPQLKQRLIKTFFEVYPKLAAEYNPKTLKTVTFSIDTTYDGVAATANGKVTFNPAYMSKHAGDIDVVTHETMHIVQDYGNSLGPGWLTEGIADFARYKFGIANEEAHWKLVPPKESDSYKNSYRTTAAFFAWMEKNIKPGIVKTVDAKLRDHTYTSEIWKDQTGKDLDDLWQEYLKNPNI